MGIPGRSTIPALTLCLLAAGSGSAHAQVPLAGPEHVTDLAATASGHIVGTVSDDTGNPLEGVVVSALGPTSAIAVTDQKGQYALGQLLPGPYLVRAHREGFLTVRGTIVEVRPLGRTPSSFTMRREGEPSTPHLAEASMAGTAIGARPASATTGDERSESGLAWRLRRLKRSILREADTAAGVPAGDDFSFIDPFAAIGRAVETSARAAGALFADISLDGQVDLLTTGTFDSPMELLETDRTRSVAFFSVGANVGSHGAWAVRAAMNQGDLDSWLLSGSYAARAGVPHRYEAGMSYSLQRYLSGNAAALATVPDTARNVGAVYAFDEWSLSPKLSLGYGATYAHYDYLAEPSLLSPRVSAAFTPSPQWRIRGLAARQRTAPGAREFLPPTRSSWLPPQRTFSPLSRDGFRTQGLEHYEIGIERMLNGATIGVRAFRQRIDDQMVTLFGIRRPDSPAAAMGHYYVGTVGDAGVQGLGVSFTHALAANVRGSVDYALSMTQWSDGPPSADAALLGRMAPVVLRGTERERVHDVMTSVETEVPQTATRVVVFYRLNSAFLKSTDLEDARGLDGRFDLQVNQALPFLGFLHSQWEMLLAVRNMFHEAMAGASTYDEILVVRPPKRIVGGLTVRF